MTNVYALSGYGIYTSLFDRFLQGYELNEISACPKKEIKTIWNGKAWETEYETEYHYEYDDKGNPISLKYTDKDGDSFLYTYKYAEEKIISVEKSFLAKGGTIPDTSELKISYSDRLIKEESYENNVYKGTKAYTLDSAGRIVTIESTFVNPFLQKLQRAFLLNIYYSDNNSTQIQKITRIGLKNEPEPTEAYSYTKNGYVINSEDGYKEEVYYTDGLLTLINSYTPNGEYPLSQVKIKYDDKNRIIEYINQYHDSLDKTDGYSMQDTRYLYEY